MMPAEPYEWLVRNFTDWEFTFISGFLYYQGMDTLDDMQKDLYRQGMAAFGRIAPTYYIELLEKPTIVWDFNLFLLAIQMMFSFMLIDGKSSLKVCKHCGKVFLASRPNTVFCSGKCKNQYNVYKSREKDRRDIDVSQFMMCKSKANLEEYGGKLFSLQKSNNELYRFVLNKYYPDAEYYDIWIIENIHDFCNEVLEYDRFIVSELYHVLDELYDLCEWIILWYGGEYDDLEEIHTKKEFVNYVKSCIENPCCEIYAKVCT